MYALMRQKSTLFQWLVVPLWVPTGKDSVPTDSGGIPLTRAFLQLFELGEAISSATATIYDSLTRRRAQSRHAHPMWRPTTPHPQHDGMPQLSHGFHRKIVYPRRHGRCRPKHLCASNWASAGRWVNCVNAVLIAIARRLARQEAGIEAPR